MFKIIKSKFLSSKKLQLAIAVVLSMAILLIAFGGNKDSAIVKEKEEYNESVDFQDYEKNIETRIETIINSISGLSEAKAFVYIKNSVEIVYAEDTDKKFSSDGSVTTETQSIVFTKDGSKNSAVIIKKLYPEIKGVLVVAKGLNDEKKRIMVINALASVLGINISSIEVLSG